jgi:hypothetical protein
MKATHVRPSACPVRLRLLRDAVSKGFKDVAHMHKDNDFDPLRQRQDFQQVLAELEGQGK